MTDSSVRVPEVSPNHDGREVDCEVIVRDGVNYYKQRTNAHGYYQDVKTGIYLPHKGDSGCSFTMDYETAIARGLVAGAILSGAYGEHVSVGAESGILWPNGAYALPPAAGIQPSIVSTSVNDAAAGTGIRTIEVHYLDANLTRQIETVTLNGTTDVPMVATNVRFIEDLHMVTYGSLKKSDGTISAHVGAQNYAQIETGGTHGESSIRMVPAGKRIVVTGAYSGASSGAAAASVKIYFVTTYSTNHDYAADSIFIPISAATYQDGSGGMSFKTPLVFTAGMAFGMSYSTDKAATIIGSWFGYEDNA